ncbi:FCD domain-containing protein [Variovorax sp. V59]|jgi:GntR family transcriptional repressor for pyruvate dehydrogenase complex|uniref:GntR family transcriptional repressor for pyruvate dehydrogenase complex n=2 Tax=Variovorax TaxID=34072 RepID=A0AAE3XW31_VARPD|nr:MULTISPECIES: FadR/GntR family transcriptional regulator [Variovorax]MDP9965931.1 GntR family transcriptional repressor for pyruvate dehydrogenase complex [Variovorax paradoxus]MDR6425710.1 GntR family transcriptional repressor for pyruvate dehydrogenase complex [Variovorax paradoxus]MDR6453047.1 GntR family transcriptional repressor for pyruvate dehydrogenase complex [Variovorax paradoxus]TWD90717.1 GntR family transcriptional regulator [Variovorax beijingensis]
MTARFQSIAPGARLADQVADALAAEVRSGRLSEGDRLPTEAALAEQFGVSRTVVREAVSRLKSLGLLDSRQGSGVYVRAAGVEPLRFEMPHVASREAVIQMVELRRALEAEVAALAAERRTPDDVQRIQEAIGALHAAVAAGGNGAEEDVRFHRAIAEAARNPFLIGTLQYLRQFLHGATRVTRANEARRADFAREVAQEHARIVEAIEAGDPLRAREAAKSHMDNAIRRIEQADPAFWQQEGAQLARPLVEGWPVGS